MKRKSSKRNTGNRKSIEFSKVIVILTGLLFVLTLIDIRGAVRIGVDVSGYSTQQIITTGGIFGASIVFYLNKSKIENLSKGKIRYALLKLRLELRLKDKIPEESYQLIIDEINEIDGMIEGKLDGALEEAIQREVEHQNY